VPHSPFERHERPAVLCEPRRHGGGGGQGHELRCDLPRQFRRTQRGPPAPAVSATSGPPSPPVDSTTDCLRWRTTGGCDPDGPIEEEKDLGCLEFVPSDRSGFCECTDGGRASPSGCGHPPLICAESCAAASTNATRGAVEERGGEHPDEACDETGSTAAVIVGIYGSHRTAGRLESFGVVCSDGTRSALVPGGGASGGPGSPFVWVCPGWEPVQCVDLEPHCVGWASAGECDANAGYMHVQCPLSCAHCPAVPPAELLPPLTAAATSLAVRAGVYVDAIQLRCGGGGPQHPTEPETSPAPSPSSREEMGQEETSPWFGLRGGAECPVACEDSQPLAGLTVHAGSRIDSVRVSQEHCGS